MKPRGYRDQVFCLPDEKLDAAWATDQIAGFVVPDIALTSIDSLTGFKDDKTALCRVVSVGPGCLDTPDVSDVRLGDVVLFDLFGCSKVIPVDGVWYLQLPFKAIRARVCSVGEPAESVQAINDWVLTREDEAAAREHCFGPFAPIDWIRQGGPTDAAGHAESMVRFCLERVVNCGSGVWKKGGLDKPQQAPGTLVGFSPNESCRFRRQGVWYRLTPATDVHCVLEE